jgi:nucleotide-binding universal stress UspA family protein
MYRLLVPVDGSTSSERALAHLLKVAPVYKDGVEVHLLNVQRGLPGDIGLFISRDQIQSFHREQGEKALAPARARLDAAGVPYATHILVGEPGSAIAQAAREKNCDQILMGTRGHGGIPGLFLGSVAWKVIELTDVPVLLVK